MSVWNRLAVISVLIVEMHCMSLKVRIQKYIYFNFIVFVCLPRLMEGMG